MNKQETHRPGVLKQSNKPHKTGRHRSKSAVNNEVKGKQNVIRTSLKHSNKKGLNRQARRNLLTQIRKKKREEVIAHKRSIGGAHSAPILICIIPLQYDIDVEDIVSSIKDIHENVRISTTRVAGGLLKHVSVPHLKQRFAIFAPWKENIFAILDAIKVATTIVFVTSATSEKEIIDDWGREVVVSCLAQGLPTTIVAAHNIQKLHIKKRQDYKQSVQHAISKWLPEEKIQELDTASDYLNMLRRAGAQKQRSIFYRNIRPHLLVEKSAFQHDEDSVDSGTLAVTGYLRGASLSINGLIHIPDFGNYQMSSIEVLDDPYPIERKKCSSDDQMDLEDCPRVNGTLLPDLEKQESLESECIPDPMDAEQTWPTEEELAEATAKKKITKIVPKGTSEYQAAWIPDEDGKSLSEDSEDEDVSMDVSMDEAKSEADSSEDLEDDEEYETMTISEAGVDGERYDQDINVLEENQAMEKFKEAKLDAQFPDEVDTPQDMSAKLRFQKYRGLESFRTSPWDPKENLPIDYARIIEFADYNRRRKRVYKEREDVEGIMPGEYVRIYIARVRKEVFNTFITGNRTPIVVGLLEFEHKMSVMNVLLKHSNNTEQPIKSKERLIFQCGFRRFAASPIFSQHTNGTKHKYERYFHPDSTVVASMYAPVTFSPCPILCYLENENGQLELIATGNVLSCDPNRIVLKRVVLSGHPYKVNKRSVVVRFMFFHREDIEWFKPVQLRTKYGRRGHIKEPLGTHGHMKCVFNGQLKSQDTVLMNLYKRVFPKWSYESLHAVV